MSDSNGNPSSNQNNPSKFISTIDAKWQKFWDDNHTFRTANPGEAGSEKPKFYCLDMFPYPSGEGLHVGHPLGYIATDIISRFKRMRGFNVLHPMGWDAFGLPAEQYAIQKGIHPTITTQKNIQTYKRQLSSLGLSYDWSREINTTDPQYYKWTQWIFKHLYTRGLAYQAEIPVNWCPALGTVLANDEVIDGKSERGGHPVERRPMRQWVLKITEYAERLLKDLDLVDWPESTKEHQRNWIGRSEGARVQFGLDTGDHLEVFTTRPDTLMGVTFMAIAPEHPLVARLTTSSQKSFVDAYIKEAARKSDLQRTDLAKGKSGVFTGAFAIHPLSKERIPVWVADYILMNYGTGAIMGVPAHDERDKEFAEMFHLDIKPVIDSEEKLIRSDIGSLKVNGQPYKIGGQMITKELERIGAGKATITYKLRDWLFARQRYWGEPIPVIHVIDGPDRGKSRLLADDELPIELPPVERYEPTGSGESPLAAVESWVNVSDSITGAKAKREVNTMPGSAGSSWYFLRYMDPQNSKAAWSAEAEKYWQQVDLYVGGAEHAVGHLLYSRFWHKVFFDMGLVSQPEPFKKLVHQGLMQGEDGEKMSKSRGNVVNPDNVIAEYGSDTFRLFEMFLGPLEKSKPWQTANIEGVYRFLTRYLRLCIGEFTDQPASLASYIGDIPESQWPQKLVIEFHKTIEQVTGDIEALRMNTAISALMTLLNETYVYFNESKKVPRQLIETFTLLLAPFAPHMSEEIWQLLGHKQSHTFAKWPSFDSSKTQSSQIEVPVQVNGKVRDKVFVDRNIDESALKALVLERELVKKWIDGKPIKKFIYVKERLISVVI